MKKFLSFLSLAAGVGLGLSPAAFALTSHTNHQTVLEHNYERLSRNSVVLPSQRPAYLARNEQVAPQQRPAYLNS